MFNPSFILIDDSESDEDDVLERMDQTVHESDLKKKNKKLGKKKL